MDPDHEVCRDDGGARVSVAARQARMGGRPRQRGGTIRHLPGAFARSVEDTAYCDFFGKIGSNLYVFQPKAEEIEAENQMHPPSERAGQKANPAARRGGIPLRWGFLLRNSYGEPVGGQVAACAASPDLSAVGRWSPHRVSNRGNLPPRLRVEYFGLWEIWAKIPRNRKWSGRRDWELRMEN